MIGRFWRTVAVPVVLIFLILAPVLAAAQPSTGPDEQYLSQAHQEHIAEIQAGRMAQEKGSTPTIREQGRRLVADHTTLDSEVRKVAALLDVSLPTEPTESRQAQLGRASAKSGEAFDRAWLSQEILAHRRALSAAREEATGGTSAYVKVLASQAAPVLEAHLEMLGEARVGAPPEPSSVQAGLGGAAGLTAHRAPQDVGATTAAPRRRAAGLRATRPPVRLRAPSAGLDLAVTPIAIGRDGALEIPADPATLGWWASGGAPGSGGTVVVVGHVDSRDTGTGPFARIAHLAPAARVRLTTADGGHLGYRVTGRRTYRHDRLPKALFARAGPARLALITCAGRYDHRKRHYTRALVVYATPLGP
jgi:predicted outer membrane protein